MGYLGHLEYLSNFIAPKGFNECFLYGSLSCKSIWTCRS
jgi:hypothetical protein